MHWIRKVPDLNVDDLSTVKVPDLNSIPILKVADLNSSKLPRIAAA